MKYIYLLISCFTLLCSGANAINKDKEFSISGKIQNAYGHDIRLVAFVGGKKESMKLDTFMVAKDGTISFHTKLDHPHLVYFVDVTSQEKFTLFGENEPATLNGDLNRPETLEFKGGKLSNIFENFSKCETTASQLAYLKKYSDSPAVAAIMIDSYAFSKVDEMKAAFDCLDSVALKDNYYYNYMKKKVIALINTTPGRQATNFTLPDPNGKKVSLSDYKDKVLIVDFWASWCAPCRAENPKVLKIYNKYHKDGLEILSISMDRSRTAWLNAVKQDKLPWKQVSDLKEFKGPVPVAYGINAIPHTFLLYHGKVVANGLRGARLASAVKTIFDKEKTTYAK